MDEDRLSNISCLKVLMEPQPINGWMCIPEIEIGGQRLFGLRLARLFDLGLTRGGQRRKGGYSHPSDSTMSLRIAGPAAVVSCKCDIPLLQLFNDDQIVRDDC